MFQLEWRPSTASGKYHDKVFRRTLQDMNLEDRLLLQRAYSESMVALIPVCWHLHIAQPCDVK